LLSYPQSLNETLGNNNGDYHKKKRAPQNQTLNPIRNELFKLRTIREKLEDEIWPIKSL
jgi:hypothetical protein